jgi:hypothetical protein
MRSLLKKIGGLMMIGLAAFVFSVPAAAKGKAVKSKFYDFSDQVIDGEVKKPTTLYTEVRQKAKFSKLLNLQRHFMNEMLETAKRPIFK